MKYRVSVNNKSFDVELLSRRGTALAFAVGGESYNVDVAPIFDMPATSSVTTSIPHPAPSNTNKTRAPARAASGDVVAPMPGVIVSVAVAVGAEVTAGTPLLVMEAMKMENSITAPRAGKVSKILVKPGQQVEGNQALISIE